MAFYDGNGNKITLLDFIVDKMINLAPNGGGFVIDESSIKQAFRSGVVVEFSNGDKFPLRKIIGYFHKYDNVMWAPIVLQMIDDNGNLVHNFLYIRYGKNWQFVNSGVYGPNLWPNAYSFISQIINDDLLS